MSDFTTAASLGTLTEKNAGELILAGQLDYRNGKQLWQSGSQIIQKSSASHFTLDCSRVTRTSSVGLSLILSLIRQAKKAGKKLTIKTLTTDLDDIARFSGVSELLPLEESFKVIEKATE